MHNATYVCNTNEYFTYTSTPYVLDAGVIVNIANV